jgi:hypothetical protein
MYYTLAEHVSFIDLVAATDQGKLSKAFSASALRPHVEDGKGSVRGHVGHVGHVEDHRSHRQRSSREELLRKFPVH